MTELHIKNHIATAKYRAKYTRKLQRIIFLCTQQHYKSSNNNNAYYKPENCFQTIVIINIKVRRCSSSRLGVKHRTKQKNKFFKSFIQIENLRNYHQKCRSLFTEDQTGNHAESHLPQCCKSN